MATAVYRTGFAALRCIPRTPFRRKFPTPPPTLPSFRTLITPDIATKPDPPVFPDNLDPDDRIYYDSLSREEKLEFQQKAKAVDEHFSSAEVQMRLSAAVSEAAQETDSKLPVVDESRPKIKVGLMAMGEEDEQGAGEDEEFQGDDISSLAHGELEQHREMREYARIAAWEMPLLSKLAKPFTPPSLDRPLRFRYTTYMGETHPAAKKIVLEFCTRDLPSLTEAQRIKLIKLVGPRYNPQTDIVKMSSEMFETQAQNKRYLGDLVDTLMEEARNGEDMFEDVPVDFRHFKEKKTVEFPDEWKMTEARRRQLEVDREGRARGEKEREERGEVADGLGLIGNWVRSLSTRSEPVLAQVKAGTGKKGKGKVNAKARVRR